MEEKTETLGPFERDREGLYRHTGEEYGTYFNGLYGAFHFTRFRVPWIEDGRTSHCGNSF